MELYSKEYEKTVLAGILKYPDVIVELSFIEENDFGELNRVVFSAIKNLIAAREHVNTILVAQKLKDLGVSFPNVTTFEYVQALELSQPNRDAIVPIAKELKKLTVRREIHSIGAKLQKEMLKADKRTFTEIISAADKIYSDKISLYYDNAEDPVNIFEGLEQEIDGREVQEEVGLKCPYKEFARLYGGFKPRNIYAIASRPGHGKTTFLDWTAHQVANVCNAGTPVLLLDTEMDTIDIKLRMVSALSKVPMWYIETGNYRRDQTMLDKVRAVWPLVKSFKLYHIHVGNKDIDEVINLTKRWYMKNVPRGNPAFIVYDYLKLTGSESVSEAFKEYQVIGEKINRLKHEVAEDLNSVVCTAIQLNRSGEGNIKNDTASAMALSDRLAWFASYLGIFRRKYPEEITEDGLEFGDHKLITLKTRFQGRDGPGHLDLVKRNNKYEPNYLCFAVKDFSVEEVGSLADIVDKQATQPTGKTRHADPDADKSSLD